MRPRIVVASTNSRSAWAASGKRTQLRLGAVGALVDGHAPAGVVLLGLADQRVLRLEQLVPDRDRLRGDAAEHAAHDGECLPRAEGANLGRARLRATMSMQGAGAEADLVGAAAQAVRAGAAGGRGEEPPPRAARGRDRVPARQRRAAWWSPRCARATTWARTRRPAWTGTTCRSSRPQAGRRRWRSCCRCCGASCGGAGRWRVHGDRHTDFVAAVCAAHLHEARGVDPAEALARAARGRPRR